MNSPRMAEKYARGALSIILKFDGETGRNAGHCHDGCTARCWRKGITFHCSKDVPVWSYNVERRMASRAQNWRYFDVLIRVVQLTELVEVHAFPADKGFRSLEGVFYPLAGCFYSVARGFEIDLVVACRELEIAILRPVVDTNHLPSRVIKGRPQIMNSVAYYRGKRARQFFEKTNSETKSAGCKSALTLNRCGFSATKMANCRSRSAMW